MATESFSLVVANLFVGMLRNHRFLPSGITIGRIGYDLFRLEPSVVVTDGRVTPDAIATSARQGHALVAEWTADVSVEERKKQQVAGYAKIRSADLITYGVPSNEAQTFDVWIVVPTEGATPYAEHFQKKGYGFGLASFRLATDEQPEYELAHVCGGFSNSALSSALQQTWHLERIPRGYLPFSIDDLASHGLAENIAQQLVAFSVRGTQAFTVEELCRGMVPVWQRLDVAKRRAVAGATLRVLNSWSRRGLVASWLKRAKEIPPTWQILLPTGLDRDRFRRALRSCLTKVQRDIAAGQGELPLHEDASGDEE